MKSFSRLTGSSFLTKSLCGFLVTIFIGNFSSVYAQTEPNPVPIDSAEALAVDAKLYAQAYGVSQEEAVKRLSIMFDINAAVNAAESEESDDFAGSYIDNNAAQFAVVIRTKKANKADRILRRKARAAAQDPATKAKRRAERRAERKAIRAKLKLTDGEVEQAENILEQDVQAPLKFKGGAANSVRKLQAAIDASAPNFAALSGFQTAFVDHKTGEVVLMVNAKSPDVVSAEAAKFLKVPYRIELVPGGFVNTALRGGQFISNGLGTRVCMTSFAAKHQDGRTGVVTAGHCKPAANAPSKIMSLNDGGTNHVMTQGTPIDSPTAGDLMFLSGAPTAVAEFYYDGTVSVRSVTGTMSRADTMAGNGTATTVGTTSGSFVCHLGQETLGSSKLVQSCGEVVSTTTSRPNNILSFTGGSYVLVRNTQSGAGTVQTTGRGTLRCFQGDSGGPWFGNNTALGVQSSCSWKGGILNGTAEYVLYTSVDAFPSIGVEILVK
jgi:hypothetical protein